MEKDTFRRISVLIFSLFLIFFCTDSCTKREWANPFDDLDPATWAPGNLQVEDVSITEKKLTWTYENINIEGFKLDRKKGDEVWQEAFQTLPKEARSYIDANITPDTALTYSYRLYAYAGKNVSEEKTTSIVILFPAPSNLQTEKLSDKRYKLTWTDNSDGEQGFKIDRRIDAGNWIFGYGNVAANQTTFTDTNVFRSINVEYQVYAYYESYVSDKVAHSTNAALTAPTDLQITSNSITSVYLTWQDKSNGEEGFKVERKTESGSWEQVATTPSGTFTDNDFQLNTLIYYRVCAYVGLYLSSYAENSFNSAIPPPINLQTALNALTSITLTWNDNSNGEDGFKIDRKVGTQNWETSYATVGGNINSWQNISVPLNETIYYRVYAYRQTYNSTYVEQSISTIIPAPTNFYVVMDTLTSIKLFWTDIISGEDGFKIDRKIGTQNWETDIATIDSNLTTWQNTNFPLNETIYYRVYTFKQAYISSLVEESVSTQIPPATNLILIVNSTNSVTLTWQDNSNSEEGFKIDRRISSGSWQIAFATTPSNTAIYTDNAIDLSNNAYSYRVYSYFNSYNSSTIENIIDHPCGINYTFNHSAGSIAPVSKTVNYGTVETNLTDSDKCWITQNLGADNQATSATDTAETSAGWYWQFNRMQGFKHDGMTRTPNSTWITNIYEYIDWQAANDPCTLLLGSTWRLPTITEWENADVNGEWDNYNETYNSILKLHAAGFLLTSSDGSLGYRGVYGYYWSSSHFITDGYYFGISSGSSYSGNCPRASGHPIRCLRDM